MGKVCGVKRSSIQSYMGKGCKVKLVKNARLYGFSMSGWMGKKCKVICWLKDARLNGKGCNVR